jgi:hypothetical protein
MKQLTLILSLVLLNVAGCSPAQQQAAVSPTAKDQVAAATAAWVAAYNSRNPARITACMIPKLCFGGRHRVPQ